MNIFQQYLSLGLSVIPCDGKIPMLAEWKQYQEQPANGESQFWIGNVAIICGKVSGGVLCVDFDLKNGDVWDKWIALINEQYPELLSKLVIESTPSGGYHVIFRTPKAIRNLKLACNKENKAMIETRGEGGYFVCAPSKDYAFYYSDFTKLCTLTTEETEIILSTAASLNEYVIETEHEQRSTAPAIPGELTPFDDYNTRHDIVALLEKHGWKKKYTRNGATFFQRPEKKGRGISASWNHVPDRFYCFTTSTAFENNHIYKASAVYAVLEHSGNYSDAAKALYAAGFGSRKEQPVIVKAKTIDPASVKARLLDNYHHGIQRGIDIGFECLKNLYTVILGQLTIITGMPSHGKSQFMDSIAVNLAINNNFKLAVFSPENYPAEIHYQQLVEKITRKPFFSDGRMSREEMLTACDVIDKHFFFIDALEEDINLDSILQAAQDLIDTKGINGLILDPWNEIELSKPKDLSTTEYIGACLRRCRKFARRNKIHVWIVVHPIKMQKDKDGNYPIPELYDCEGSAHWRNKADNGICVWRNFNENTTSIFIQKIKFRYTGKTGEAKLKFNLSNGCYEELTKEEQVRLDF